MKTYKINLVPESSFESPLQSDTLFGAFCWSYKYLFGEDKLKQFLNCYLNNEPPIIFSNAFPEGLLPFPLISLKENITSESDKAQRLKIYKANKIVKKQKYITYKNFNDIINGKLSLTKEPDTFKEAIKYGNIVNRRYGTVLADEDIGGLYSNKHIYSYKNLNVFIKIKEKWEDDFFKVLDIMFKLGIGSNKSVGKGIFNITDITEFKGFSIPENPNSFIVLSNYIPSSEDPIEGSYKLLVKYPKLDREYANSEKPFKKPLLMIQPGSIFFTNKVREYYGKVVKKISNYNPDIIQNGFAFIIPSYLKG